MSRPSSPGRLFLAGVALGIAFTNKFSLIVLPVILLGIYAGRFGMAGWRHLSRSLAAAILVACGVVFLMYTGEVVVPIQDRITAAYLDETSEQMRADTSIPGEILSIIDPAKPSGQAVQWLARHVSIPAFSYFKGVYRLYNHNITGHVGSLGGCVANRKSVRLPGMTK